MKTNLMTMHNKFIENLDLWVFVIVIIGIFLYGEYYSHHHMDNSILDNYFGVSLW